MSLLRGYHHHQTVEGQSFRVDGPEALLATTGVTSWRTFRNCYVELMHPQAMLFAGMHECHRIRFVDCQVICHDDATVPCIDVSPAASNLSGIQLINCDIKGRANSDVPAVRIVNASTGGAPNVVLDGVYFSGMPGGCVELAGLTGAVLRAVDRSDLATAATKPGILIRKGDGGVFGQYALERLSMRGGSNEHPDVLIQKPPAGAIHVGIEMSTIEYLDPRGAGAWDDGRNSVAALP